MTDVQVEALDGSDPLCFLAALGLLAVLDEKVGQAATLSWTTVPPYRPVLGGIGNLEELATIVHEDLSSWDADPVLRFRYPKLEKNGPKVFGGLTPPIRVLRPWLRAFVESRALRAISYASALMTDGVPSIVESKKVVSDALLEDASLPYQPDIPADWAAQPTAFDFTSRNTQFLDQIDQIRMALNYRQVLRELESGAPTDIDVRTMSWDRESVVPGALVGRREVRRYPTTEWLAFRGLVHCPVLPTRVSAATRGCSGRRKEGFFCWPVWEAAVGSVVASALLGYPDLKTMSAAERRARGILAVFCAELTKGADGYQGVFAPASSC